jgi:hypothetical protein
MGKLALCLVVIRKFRKSRNLWRYQEKSHELFYILLFYHVLKVQGYTLYGMIY